MAAFTGLTAFTHFTGFLASSVFSGKFISQHIRNIRKV
jgi:hypothetical protein